MLLIAKIPSYVVANPHCLSLASSFYTYQARRRRKPSVQGEAETGHPARLLATMTLKNNLDDLPTTYFRGRIRRLKYIVFKPPAGTAALIGQIVCPGGTFIPFRPGPWMAGSELGNAS